MYAIRSYYGARGVGALGVLAELAAAAFLDVGAEHTVLDAGEEALGDLGRKAVADHAAGLDHAKRGDLAILAHRNNFV